MDYIIGNKEEKLYIRIQDGKAVTCSRNQAQYFEYSKACNIRKNLPKSLNGTKFNVMAVSGDDPVRLDVKKASVALAKKPENDHSGETKKIYLKSTTYQIPPKVYQWADRVRNCNDLTRDAQKRKAELEREMSENNNMLVNVEHTIELEDKKNMYDGYIYYMALRDCLIKRRKIKDELMVVDTISNADLSTMASDCSKQVENDIKFMANRQFEYRQVKAPKKEAS